MFYTTQDFVQAQEAHGGHTKTIFLMDQADDNSLTALLTKREQVRFREIVNTCTERRAEKRIQRTA